MIFRTTAKQILIGFGNLTHLIRASGTRPEHVAERRVLFAKQHQEQMTPIAAESKRLFGVHISVGTLILALRLALDGMRLKIYATLVPHNA